MVSRKLSRLLPAELVLASGLLLHNWLHGDYAEATSGFLIGMSAVLMIAG